MQIELGGGDFLFKLAQLQSNSAIGSAQHIPGQAPQATDGTEEDSSRAGNGPNSAAKRRGIKL